MFNHVEGEGRFRWFSLPVRISAGLVFAAIIPLFILLIFTNVQTKPALVDQANKAMASDAQTRVEVIDNYFNERVSDAYTLTQVPTVQSFLALPNDPQSAMYQDARMHALYALQAGMNKDKNYANWSLFDKTGQLRLAYPGQPAPHGQYMVPPDALQTMAAGKVFVSPVYASAARKEATIEIYVPIVTPQVQGSPLPPGVGLGFMRSTLKLDYIWNRIVQSDLGNNGERSYAFILDENGVRIADTDATRRFSSVDTLPVNVQQQIVQEARYGDTTTVQVLTDQAVAESNHSRASTASFQAQPAGQNEQFQIVRQATTNPYVHWNYFVLSPVSTVTAVANKELANTTLIAIMATLLVAIIGLFAGRGLVRPILHAVEQLRGSSQALSVLATNQQDAAEEQMWVVDSSQVGLQSVQYYTDASKVALKKLHATLGELPQRWQQQDVERVEYLLEYSLKAVRYLESAVEYQHSSNQKLATALKVATQVTEQLHAGATSATEAADQLEQVVRRLRAVVGQRTGRGAPPLPLL